MNKDDAREAAAIHELKTWPQYFQAITSGEKTFEIRKNDRGFKVGDTLRLCNYDPDLGRFTGHTVERKIAYIAQGVFGLPDDVCVMSLAGAASVDRKAIVREFQRRASAELCPTPDGYVYHVLNKIAKEMEGKHET